MVDVTFGFHDGTERTVEAEGSDTGDERSDCAPRPAATVTRSAARTPRPRRLRVRIRRRVCAVCPSVMAASEDRAVLPPRMRFSICPR